MNRVGAHPAKPSTIALIGNYLPRRCGIATFTTDLLAALSTEVPDMGCWAMVMNDQPNGYAYPPEVRFELSYKKLSDYRLAADFLNMRQADGVCVQHEFGIFGGPAGSHILELLRGLRMPVVTTLHTVKKNPMPEERAVLEELGRVSDRLVVMSSTAARYLWEIHGISANKTVVIPHGIPDVPFIDPNYYKDQFGVEGRRVILTFGLLSPGKGIEHMIDALPRIVSKYPETTYIVLGATHPNVLREAGESYRLSLQRRAREHGVEKHLVFHNRFVELKELCEFLGAADIYVTPYLNREQIVSGALAYALGAGKAAVSTPYWYAEEMLADGRGRLVPFRDPDALAEEILDLFRNEIDRHAMRKRAYNHCRSMIWKEVARRYVEVFAEVKEERQRHPRIPFQAKTLKSALPELPRLELGHLRLLTDDVGILQHANFTVPNRSHGYCTDDNARALIVVLMAQELTHDDKELLALAGRYMSFLYHAFDPELGSFRNFMGYDRRWLEATGSQDANGRALWALGKAVALSTVPSLTGAAVNLLKKSLPVALALEAPRAMAFALIGVAAYLERFSGDSEVKRVLDELSRRLFDLYRARARRDWPWLEDVVTYANGRIPQALLLAGRSLEREEVFEAGIASLRWLLEIQKDPKGHLVPIGNNGWYQRGRPMARFDQQPVEAQNLIDACVTAFDLTGDRKWFLEAQRCFDWFLGRNDLKASLYDYHSGGCCDGLTPDGPNLNQGAESTLAWLLSLLHMDRLSASETVSDTLSGTRAVAWASQNA